MTHTSCRFPGAIAGLVLAGIILSPAISSAQSTVAGDATYQSRWTNGPAVLTPPGDGTGDGSIMAGLWNSGSQISGTPAYSTTASGPAALSTFSYGNNYAYTIAAVPNGTYTMVAWVDGNANGAYDTGEPRSLGIGVTVTNNLSGVNDKILDDTDSDTLADWWEVHYFNDLSKNGSDDYDKDGLSNKQEFDISRSTAALVTLDPSKWDTDSDEMDDGWEYTYYCYGTGTDPCLLDWNLDADGDGLLNGQEYRGIDGYPVRQQDPAEASGISRVHPSDKGDVLNPADVDTDNDYLVDSFEATWYDPDNGIDPKSEGSYTADQDKDGFVNFREQCLLTEFLQNGSSDIWSGGPDGFPSVDGNGLRDFSPPVALGATLTTIESDLTALRTNSWTDPTYGGGWSLDTPIVANDGWDTDRDNLPDGWEVEYNLDPKSNAGNDGYFGDPDLDGLLNFQEYMGQDGARKSDTDYLDGTGDETNPNEHNWRPDTTAVGNGAKRPVVAAGYWSAYSNSPPGTIGSSLPTASLGYDGGIDTDDDGMDDDEEIHFEYEIGVVGSSPVHSTDPFTKKCIMVTNNAGIYLADPEGNNCPLLHSRNWTVECYVKIFSANRSGVLVECPGPYGTGDIAFRLALSNDVPWVGFDTLGLYRYYVTGLPIPTNKWTHLAGVWSTDDNSLSLYVDGVFAQKQTIKEESLANYMFEPAARPVIGYSYNNTFANQVCLDEVRIWKIPRSVTDIEEYRTKIVPQSSTGLVAYYRFDDGGRMAEDFARKAKNSRQGAASENYFYGDHGYSLSNNFSWVTNDYAPVRGVSPRGSDDTDSDGMPDGWEMVNNLDPLVATNQFGADGDVDGDGLKNIYEFWSGTNPRDEDTDQDGILDVNEDRDNDGLVNKAEQDLGSRPDMVDTDDDGSTDNNEQASLTSPSSPTDPAIPRSMKFGGSTNDYIEVRNQLAQRLTSWTLEAWVLPTNSTTGDGIIVRRVVETPAGRSNAVNFVMGLEQNGGGLRPYAGYCFTNGSNYIARGANIPAATWTHVAASYNSLTATLTIYTNGAASGTPVANAFMAPPINGKGGETYLRIGEGFQGWLDDVRLWNDVRTPTELGLFFDTALDGTEQGLVHYFRFDDSQAETNASFPAFTEYFQANGPQDFTVTEDWNNEWVHAGIMHGTLSFASGGPIGVPPSITVILDPSGAIDGGAQWTLDGGDWRNSAAVVITEEGQHSIIYKSVDGWTEPSSETVTLTNNDARTLTRSYYQNGSLRINLEPQGARDDGAAWAVDGGMWQNSGSSISNLAPGTHTVSFKDVADWIAPVSSTELIVSGQPTVGTYAYSNILGSLMVVIEPSSVVSNGAQWRIDSGLWQNSGAIAANLALGLHTVQFSTVLPWITPSNLAIEVKNTAMMIVTSRYTQITGLQVVISPASAISEGARWRVAGSATWQNSGDLLGVGVGTYTVEFYDLPGWIEPPSQTAVVTNDVVTFIEANYYDMCILGGYGSTLGRFNKPRGLAATDRLLYIADSGNDRIQILDTLTGLWSSFGSRGTTPGKFNQPFGVAVDGSGNIWVADANNNRVQVRNAVSGAWSSYGSKGTEVGRFNAPVDIKVDSAGNVYVADHYNSRIQKRTASSGAWSVIISSGTGGGYVRYPNGVGLDSREFLYVTDYDLSSKMGRVQKFDRTGMYMGTIGNSTAAAGEFKRPMGVAGGPSTNIVVADISKSNVQEYGGSNNWSVVMDAMFLIAPEGVAVDRWGNIFVSNTGSNSILWLAASDNDSDDLVDIVETDTGIFAGLTDTGTISTNSDTDGDFIPDGWEARYGSDPNDASSFPWKTPGDYDGDGMADMVQYLGANGAWYLHLSSDWRTHFGYVLLYGWSEAQAVSGDYDGDWKTDIAVYWPAGGMWYISSGAGVGSVNWGWSEAKPVPGDYDGDGATDIAVYWPAGGTWYILYSGGGSRVQAWGWSDAKAVPGDYDGDGTTDIAVYWPAGGRWYIINSSGGTRSLAWGWGGATPVPGDYDGDGTTDIAVYWPAGGRWYILYSSTGGTAVVDFGWSEGTPAQADYDGDGITDIAVFHSGGATWHIRCSSGGGGQFTFGPAGGNAVAP